MCHIFSTYTPFLFSLIYHLIILDPDFINISFSFLTIYVSVYRRQCGERSSPEEARPCPCQPPLHFQWVSGGFGKGLEWILSITGDWQLWLLVPHKHICGI